MWPMSINEVSDAHAKGPDTPAEQVFLTGSDADIAAAYDAITRRGVTVLQVARSLGVSRWTVYRRAKRAKQRLAEQGGQE